jgi:hypothetical protein
MRRVGMGSDRMIALFLLGVLGFNAPLLSIFNTDARLLGIPMLYFYLFVAWAALIVLMACTTRRPEGANMAATPSPGRSSNESES